MIFEDIKQLIVSELGADVVTGEETDGLQPALIIATDRIADVCLLLRDHPKTYFDFLACLTGVDYGLDVHLFGVVYHLTSIPYQLRLTLKVQIPNERNPDTLPVVPSVTSVYRTADWHEREAYDLIGIYFSNHPDLRRILLPDDWEGFPLRKDYHTAPFYKGIKIDF